MDTSKKLNKNQTKAVKHKNGPLLIIAGAGTGKTTVITERIKYLITKGLAKPEEILALTFTEKAATEMETRVDEVMPLSYGDIWIMTFHGFCGQVLRDEALHIGLPSNYKLMTEAESLDLFKKNLFNFSLDYFRPLGNPNKFIGEILKHFSRLQDEVITPGEYLKWSERFKNEDELEIKKYKELASVYKEYDDLKNKEAKFDFGDLIIKTIELFRKRPNILSKYQKKFKYILVDEFQDTNYAQNELVNLLASKDENITVVGDDNQCLPGNTKISTKDGVKKIKDIKVNDIVLTAVGKGHTSYSTVDKVFERTDKRKLLTFVTENNKKIVVTDNHKMFCFIPMGGKDKEYHYLYLMNKKNVGWRIGVSTNLPKRLKLEVGSDLIIGIGSYKTDKEARYYEAYNAAKYGLPTVAFSARPGQAIVGEWMNKLFNQLDTNSSARKIAKDLALELDSPQFMVGAVTRGQSRRTKINFEMCIRNYRSKTNKDGFVGNPSILHQVTLETSNKDVLSKLRNADIYLIKAKKGLRVRKSFVNLSDAWNFADQLQKITDGIIDKRFKVGRYNYQHLPARIVPASHIFPGMYLPVLVGRKIVYKKVVSRNEQVKKTKVYDLEIAKTHNFIADGVVVHNSIYKFRGAAISNILKFKENYKNANLITLNENYRSTQEILDGAYKLIKHNDPDTLEAKLGISKKLEAKRNHTNIKTGLIHTSNSTEEAEELTEEIKKLQNEEKYNWKDFAILVRANNHADLFIRELERQGIPHQFLGPSKLFEKEEVSDLISYLKILYDPEDSINFYKVLSSSYLDLDPLDVIKISVSAKRKSTSIFEEVLESNKEKVKKLVSLINTHLKDIKTKSAGEILFDFLKEFEVYEKLLEGEEDVKAKNISKFFEKIKTYENENPKAKLRQVVDYIDLLIETGETPMVSELDWTENDAVNILTVHSAKGLEFPVVFLVNLVSERFPARSRMDQIPIPDELIKEELPEGNFHLQEERRLFYVGMTRAKERLYLTASDFYGDGKRKKKISPFVPEALGEKVDDKLSIINTKKAPLDSDINHTSSTTNPSLKINFLSVSQIETFQNCPLHYKLKYIYKIPTPLSPSISFGLSIHKTLKDFMETKKDILKLFKDNWIEESYLDKKHKRDFYKKGEDYLLGFLKNSYNEEIKNIALESSFKYKITKDLIVGGTIDRVDELGGGRIEIIDYKTGANIPTQKEVDKNLQLSVYCMVASDMYKVPPEKIKLSLYYLDNQEKITTSRTKEELEKVKAEILKIREEIQNSDFKCNNGYFCQTGCEYSMFCKSKN